MYTKYIHVQYLYFRYFAIQLKSLHTSWSRPLTIMRGHNFYISANGFTIKESATPNISVQIYIGLHFAIGGLILYYNYSWSEI